MIYENDNFSIPEALLQMSVEELQAAKEKKFAELKRVRDTEKQKRLEHSPIKL